MATDSRAARIYLPALLLQLLLGFVLARRSFVPDGSVIWSPAATSKIGEDRVEVPSAAFRALLEAEADATALALTLYSRKRDLLAAKLAVALARQENATLEEQQQPNADRNRTRRARSKAGGHRVFSDWLELRDSIRLDGARFKLDAASADGLDANTDNKGDLVRMIALHANPKPVGRSPHPPTTRKPTVERDAPLLQFVAVMERKTSTLHMYHPVTHELMWQAQLPEIRDVASFSVASDRRSHLAILTSAGKLALYSLRVWHHGRAISGGFRRVDPLGPQQCLLTSYDSLIDRPGLPWRPPVPQSSPAPGKHLHIDFELVFRVPAAQSVPELPKYLSEGASASIGSSDRSWSGNVVVTGRFRHDFAITSDSNGTLSFFHTENGTFAGDLVVNSSRQPVTQFVPMAGGIVALAIRNHIYFVDVASRRAVGAVCEVSASQTITSIKADPSSPFTIYAGLSSGRGLVFRLRQVGLSWQSQSDEEPSHVRPECLLVAQLRPRRELVEYKSHRANRAAAPAQLMTKTLIDVLPGYLVMSVDSRLVLFQLTTGGSGHPVYLSEHDMLTSHRDSNDRVVALSTAVNVAEHPVALVVHVVAASGTIRLDVYASLQPPPPPASLNLSWLRFPVVLLCVVAALFWQQRAQGSGPHAHLHQHGDGLGLPPELFGANPRRANWRKTKS